MNVGGLGIRPELLRNLPNAREPGKPPLKQFALEYDPDRAKEDWDRGLYTLRGRVIAPLEPPIRRVRNVLTFLLRSTDLASARGKHRDYVCFF
jgi:hypothetical protein